MAERDHLKRLARGGTATLIGAASSAVCGIVLVVVITRGFDKETAGTFFAASALFVIALAVVELGTDAGLTRLIPQKLVHGQHQLVPAVLFAAVLPVLLLSTAAAVLLWVFAGTLGQLIADSSSADFTALVRILVWFLPVAAVFDTLLATTRGLGTMRTTVLLENVTRLLTQVTAVLIATVAGAGIATVAVVWALPYLLGVVAAAAWLRRLAGRQSIRFTLSARDRETSREFWRFTRPRSFARISQIALKRADIVLVAALASPAEAAIYTAATRFMVVGQLGVKAIQQVLAPQLSRLFAEGATDQAREVAHTSTTWSVMLAWPLYLGCAVLAPLVLSIFGSGYSSGNEVVVILALTMLVGVGTGPVDVILLMAGRSWLSFGNNLLAVVLDLGLDVVLIPRYGILGAAIAWSVAIVVSNLAAVAQVWRHLHMTPADASTLRVGAAALACFGLAPGVLALLGAAQVSVVLALLVGMVAYVGALLHWRQRLALDVLLTSLRRRASTQPQAEVGRPAVSSR